MKPVVRQLWKGYFFFSLWVSISDLIGLIYPRADSFTFYRTLMAFDPVNTFWYISALLASILAAVSLWPLYVRAFVAPRSAFGFFKFILAFRIAADLCGHRYEILFFKSAAVNNPLAAMVAVVIALALAFPSYKALYEHAFNK
jgi:hypothetical protein